MISQEQVAPAGRLFQDYFESAWARLAHRQRHILKERYKARTLGALGSELGITRERVRQLHLVAGQEFINQLKQDCPLWTDWCAFLRETPQPLDLNDLSEDFSVPRDANVFLSLALGSCGWEPQRNRSRWWMRDRANTMEVVDKLIFNEPVPKSEWDIYREESGLPTKYLEYLMSTSELPVEGFRNFIIRVKHRRLDRAHAHLLEHGPSHVKMIAEAMGEKSYRNLDGFMSRQEIFTKVYPGGEWVLTEFANVRHKRAIDAVLDLLANHGPLTKKELNRHMANVYPVSAARIDQCLSDFRVGKMSDGRIWLVERGAVKESEREPEQPAHMHWSGQIVGLRRKIDDDIMRGSGLMDSRWLAWKLGLHSTPMSRAFAGVDGLPEITVTRAGANSQLSSLREVAIRHHLSLGDSIIIFFNLERSTWALTCSSSGGDSANKQQAARDA